MYVKTASLVARTASLTELRRRPPTVNVTRKGAARSRQRTPLAGRVHVSDGAMSAVRTVTVVSVSVAVRTSLIAPIDVL